MQDKIARQNFERLENMDLYHMLTPAICPMRELHSSIWHQQCLNTDNLSISKSILESYPQFYGSLKPLDGVRPYRLEMQAKVTIGNTRKFV